MTLTDTPRKAEIRELDRRRNDGIDVRLLWDSRTDTIILAVEDERVGDAFTVTVDSEHALDAFRHPYAYA